MAFYVIYDEADTRGVRIQPDGTLRESHQSLRFETYEAAASAVKKLKKQLPNGIWQIKRMEAE